MIRRLGFALFFLLAFSGAAAQTGGQLCVRAFEDANASGRLDSGEPLLTRGVGVNLLDASGVTIASALLDTSPTAAQGVACFQFLPPGQYTVQITSADFRATTPDTITTTIAEGGLPTVVEFGAQRPAAAATTAPPELNVTQIVIAAVGALLVIGLMALLGFIVAALAFRRPPAPDLRRTTGSMHAVRDTGQMRRAAESSAYEPNDERR